VTIRPAVLADRSAVYVLVEQELAYLKALIDDGTRIPNLDWQEVINRTLTNPRERMWVAELNGNLVGYVMVCLPSASKRRPLRQWLQEIGFWQKANGGALTLPMGWIEDCFVLQETRRQGIGSALVRTALSWFKENHVRRIELGIWMGNGHGQAFWERQGFLPVRLKMSKTLNDQTD
jgi:GNAT superfamily N-acetyltransferase